jgi:hypothetical protein
LNERKRADKNKSSAALVRSRNGGGDIFAARRGRTRDEPRSRNVRARLAEFLRLQYVRLSDFKMDRRNFLRTHTSALGFGCWLDDDDSCGLDLAQRFAQVGEMAWRRRISTRRRAGSSRRIARDDENGQPRNFSWRRRANIFRFDLRDRAFHQPFLD